MSTAQHGPSLYLLPSTYASLEPEELSGIKKDGSYFRVNPVPGTGLTSDGKI